MFSWNFYRKIFLYTLFFLSPLSMWTPWKIIHRWYKEWFRDALLFLNLSLENMFWSLMVKLGSQILGKSVLSYTGGCTSLSHHIDPGFNEEWRWKGRKERNQCIFHTSSWCAYYLDSCPRMSKVLFFLNQFTKEGNSRELETGNYGGNLGTGEVHYRSLAAVVFW